jgi:hypothetical protein
MESYQSMWRWLTSQPRESANIQDVRAFTPKPDIRSGRSLLSGVPHYYDPAQGKYASSMTDAIAGLIRLGLDSRRQKDVAKQTPEERALVQSLARKIKPKWQ